MRNDFSGNLRVAYEYSIPVTDAPHERLRIIHMEILEFTVGESHYGIEIGKAEEVIHYKASTKVFRANKLIEGFIVHHGQPVTVIDLFEKNGCVECKNDKTDMLICTDFSGQKVAFRVSLIIGFKKGEAEDFEGELIFSDLEEIIEEAQKY